MRLSRRQSLVAALGVIAAFFLATFLIIKRDTRISATSADDPEQAALLAKYRGAEPPKPVSVGVTADPSASPVAEEPKFSLNEFYRAETKDGRKLWEVKAKTGQYFPETSSATLGAAEMHFYRPNGEIVDIFAENALLHLLGPALIKAEGSNGVTLIHNKKVTVKTDRAVYDRQAGVINAPGHVDILSEGIDTSGEEMKVDVEKNVLTLSRNVNTVIKPKEDSPET